MPDDPYSLADLARLADVTPRTVRYYVAQGLLPSPEAAGPATRYGEGHLARLRLIKRLQRDHLPLAEIRARLERMGDDEVLAAAAILDPQEPEPSLARQDTLDFVRSLMQQAGVQPSVAEAAVRYDAPVPPAAMRRARSLLRRVEPAAEAATVDHESQGAPASAKVPPPAAALPATAAPAAPAPLAAPATSIGPSPTRTHGDRSTWERLVIAPDVELHVRRPLDRKTNKRVDQLERIARELFEDP
jgi:DNA-binding transcriptional MerR regulator